VNDTDLERGRTHFIGRKKHDISGLYHETFLTPPTASHCARFPLLASMPPPIQHLVVGRPLKKFAFVSAAAEREYKDLPKDVQDDFGKDLRRIQYGQDPERPIKSLTESAGAGAIELIINGSPAFRCVYVAKFADMVVVLHSFVKTTNRSDRHAMQVAEERMKELKQELRKMGYRV